uniref:Uncharacterized protein n=1 Tax=uncultured organism TaxID=155900 RepID=A0A0G3VV10_9ZZZZ|nr:hypothetical protein [uncultured organism]
MSPSIARSSSPSTVLARTPGASHQGARVVNQQPGAGTMPALETGYR